MSRDSWATPPEFYDWVIEYYCGGILRESPSLDVCASETNSKCEDWIDVNTNSLIINWEPWNGIAWMNPPYSNIQPWVEKACKEAEERNVTTLALLPCDPSTKWWRYCDESKYCREIVLLNRRVQFVPPKGIKKSSNPKASAFFNFGPESNTEAFRCKYKFEDWLL